MVAVPVRIVCWSPHEPERIGDINVFVSAHLSDLQTWAQMGGVVTGRWFQARNVAAADLGTFAWLAKYSLAPAPTTTIEGAPPEAVAFFGALETAIESLRRWDLDGYWVARRILGLAVAPKH